jgi:threonylcarbamoyladenosine tRNA methylthiotransferase MtaB
LTELVKSGCKEVVLTGINLSSYGADLGEEDALLRLLAQLSTLPDLVRIRLSSLEPQLFTPAFAAGLAALPKVCPHFHLSLQSGSATVLQRMNRHYSPSEYLEKGGMLRDISRDVLGGDYLPAITTDVIVGFPGETEAEFAETEAFLRQVAFSALHVFPYSKRQGTAAAELPEQVAAAVKRERSARLLALGKEMSAEYRRRFLGKQVAVILENKKTIQGKEYWSGYTPEYLRVTIPRAKLGENRAEPGMLVEIVMPEENGIGGKR